MISFDDYLGKETLSGLWWKENIGTKLILGGGAETRWERSEEQRGSRGSPPAKFYMTTLYRSLENAPFLEKVIN